MMTPAEARAKIAADPRWRKLQGIACKSQGRRLPYRRWLYGWIDEADGYRCWDGDDPLESLENAIANGPDWDDLATPDILRGLLPDERKPDFSGGVWCVGTGVAAQGFSSEPDAIAVALAAFWEVQP